jgi:uncharacterized protein (DUF2252 family)
MAHIEIQIRDINQTVVGNPAHDLIRLGLSLASAARGSDLPGRGQGQNARRARERSGSFPLAKKCRQLVTMLRSRDDASEVKLVDAAHWMKGCSSHGRLRYAALLEISGTSPARSLLSVAKGACLT